mmetsp:Transcript_29615/g.45146  ORF Transcript_29615/g.45146 Transcript_29615/m.45146 type:complete len:95 (-) Transcript_29615:841-1125(-)
MGAVGQVIKAKHRASGEVFAIKSLLLQDNESATKSLIRELQTLKHLSGVKNNVHTIRLHRVIVPEDLLPDEEKVIFLVMDYVPNTLIEFLDNSQ